LTLQAAVRIAAAGQGILRYGLAAILLYLGAFKFTVEAEAIRLLIANSPLTAWLYGVAAVPAVSALLGTTEIAIGSLIALRSLTPRSSALASLAAATMSLVTLSFLLSTPGIWESVPGFPLPVPDATGAFLLKDVLLLGAALSTAADALGNSAVTADGGE
jgi:uncharacterized membrane protein YkgB